VILSVQHTRITHIGHESAFVSHGTWTSYYTSVKYTKIVSLRSLCWVW